MESLINTLAIAPFIEGYSVSTRACSYYLTLLNTRIFCDHDVCDCDDNNSYVTHVYRPVGWSLFLVPSEPYSTEEILLTSEDVDSRYVFIENDPAVLAHQLNVALPADDYVLKSYAKRIGWCQTMPFSYLKRHGAVYIADRDGPIVVNEVNTETGVKRSWGVQTFINEYAPKHGSQYRYLNGTRQKIKKGKKRIHLCHRHHLIIMSWQQSMNCFRNDIMNKKQH